FWDKVCHDACVAVDEQKGHFKWAATKVTPGTTFANPGTSSEHTRDPGETYPGSKPRLFFEDLDDCTHSASCCLAAPNGGGLSIPSDFPGIALCGIVTAGRLVTHLIRHKQATLVGTEGTTEDLTDKLKHGDVIAYIDDKGRYHHTALYLGGGKMAC